MSVDWQFYVITLLVFYGVNLIAVWSLNFQFGVAGILNFAFMLFPAIGAYTAALLTLGSPEATTWSQSYFLGLELAYPLPLLIAALVGGVLAFVVGLIALRPPDPHYQALVFIVVAAAVLLIVSSQRDWLNGTSGLAGVPRPLSDVVGSGRTGYGWSYVALTAVISGGAYFILQRLTAAPWGRRLRTMRDDPLAAAALGVHVTRERFIVLIVGGALAAVSGAVFVQYVGAWGPGSWTLTATFLYFTALVVGGVGNYAGAAFGVAVVWTLLQEGVRFLPVFGRAGLADMLGGVLIGVLTIVFLWVRPQGLFPERRRRLSERVRPEVVADAGQAQEPVASDRRSGTREAGSEDESPEHSFAILMLENVECSFGGVLAVDGATFGVPRGEITGLIGPNGAGKSSILNMIGGAVTPSAGQIWYEGRDIAGAPSHRIAREGIIRTFQNPRVFEELTVLENLVAAARDARGSSFGESLRSSRYWAEEERDLIHTALELLDRCDMTSAADEYAGQLSGGQKRLLELMRAFMAEPKLLLLDEPFAGILPSLGRILERELKAMRDQGITMLVVEHDLDTIERLTDSVIVMARGSVLTQGRMADLRGEREVLDAYVLG